MNLIQSKAEKRQRSNEQRLQTLERNKHARNGMVSIGGATPSCGCHITFDSSEESDGEAPIGSRTETWPPSTAKKPTPTEPSETGGEAGALQRSLFSSSSEGEEEEELVVKPQFVGRAGEKLFKLQQKIGTDERFRMGVSFMDTSGGSDGRHEDEEETLAAEKARTLKLIDSIVGGGKRPTPTKNTGLTIARYDPTASNCADLEQTPPGPIHEDSASSGEEQEGEEEEREERPGPVVSKDRFFSVTSDLRELFSGRGYNGGATFTFLSPEEEKEEEEEEEEEVGTRKPKWLESLTKPHPPPDLPESTDNAATSHPNTAPFFFHSKDSVLCNRLSPIPFSRPRPLEELWTGWGQRRAALKEVIRQRHKEATKQTRRRLRQH